MEMAEAAQKGVYARRRQAARAARPHSRAAHVWSISSFLKAASVYSLKHLPGRVRPARPARWCADALEMGETRSDSTRMRGLYTCGGGRWAADGGRRTADGGRWAADGVRRTADSGRRTAEGGGVGGGGRRTAEGGGVGGGRGACRCA